MGIAKEAPQDVIKEEIEGNGIKEQKVDAQPTTPLFDGVPFEIYKYFELSPEIIASKDTDKLRTIYEWAADSTQSMGDVMEKISVLERKLGQYYGERRYDKIWNWIKLTRNIESLEKQRNALNRGGV